MQTSTHRMDKHQGPTVQHRNYTHYPMINHNGGEYIYMCVCVCVCVCVCMSYFVVQQKLTQHCKSTTIKF